MSQYKETAARSRPAQFLNNLSLNVKFAVLGVMALGLVFYQAISFITVSQGNADFARKELLGTQVLEASNTLVSSLVSASSRNSAQTIIGADTLSRVYQPLDSSLNAQAQMSALEQAIRGFVPGQSTVEAAEAYRSFIAQVGDQSNLILDPDLDSYYVMDALVIRVPALISSLAQVVDSNRQAGPVALFEANLNALDESVAAAAQANAAVGTALMGLTQNVLASGQGVLDRTQSVSDFSQSLTAFHAGATPQLDALLNARIAMINDAMWFDLAKTFTVLVLASLLAFYILRSVTRPVQQLNHAFDGLARGAMDQVVDTERKDELGTLLANFDRTQTLLRERMEAEAEQAAENARIKLALDRASSSVMLADPDNNIIYMNDAANELFADAEDDFRQTFGDFDRHSLVGSNMDRFHRNPAHQKGVVGTLSEAMQAEVKVGSKVLSLTVVPVVDAEGHRIGTSVEWRDRTQEAQSEAEIGAVIEGALAGNLKMRVPEEGKQGFFLQASQGLNQLLSVSDGVVSDIGRMMSAMAQGDLSASIETEYQGDFNRLKRDANETAQKLREVVASTIESAELVTNGAQEIAQGNADLSHRTEEQASSLEETASSMEEMTSAIGDSAARAEEVNRLAGQAQQSAQQGGEVVREAVTAMSEINESSKQIADIIGVIDEIAFQTNLLALNAAVEAARAGEQGRGFAVVAGEVRSLAQRSAEAAKEIKDLIRDSVEKVEAGSQLVNQSGETLQTIVMNFSEVASMIDEISSAFRQQRDGVEQVNQAVAQMDEMTQQNAALVEQVSATGESLSEQARDMRRTLSFFSGQQAAVSSQPTPKQMPTAVTKPMPARAVAPVSDMDDWAEF